MFHFAVLLYSLPLRLTEYNRKQSRYNRPLQERSTFACSPEFLVNWWIVVEEESGWNRNQWLNRRLVSDRVWHRTVSSIRLGGLCTENNYQGLLPQVFGLEGIPVHPSLPARRQEVHSLRRWVSASVKMIDLYEGNLICFNRPHYRCLYQFHMAIEFGCLESQG